MIINPVSSSRLPLVVLDVDGVLALERPVVPVARHLVSAYRRWSREILVPLAAPGIVHELAECFEVVWAGAWSHMAHAALRDVLDLPRQPWPFLPVQFHKIPTIRDYAAGRPWALIDDGVHDLGEISLPEDGLLIATDPRRGIVDVRPRELLRRLNTTPLART